MFKLNHKNFDLKNIVLH